MASRSCRMLASPMLDPGRVVYHPVLDCVRMDPAVEPRVPVFLLELGAEDSRGDLPSLSSSSIELNSLSGLLSCPRFLVASNTSWTLCSEIWAVWAIVFCDRPFTDPSLRISLAPILLAQLFDYTVGDI